MRVRQTASGAAALLTAGVLAAGCSASGSGGGGGGHKTTDPPSSSPASSSSSTSTGPSPSASTTDPAVVQAQTEQTIQNAWLNFWKVSLSVAGSPAKEWPAKVAAVAVEPSYGEVINSVRTQLAAGLKGYGYIVSRPTWPAAPATGAKTAVMADCYDGSHAGSLVVKTGKKQTVGQPRTNVRVTFALGADGKWRVKQAEYLKASC